MKYLIDTCIISELIKARPSKKVVEWVSSKSEENFYLSVLTIGEIQKGISKLADSKKKENLQSWITIDLKDRFTGRILDIDSGVAQKWGEIQGSAEKQGLMMPAIDALIAATAICHGLTVVTRNIQDMQHSGARLYNPWEGK